MILRTLLWRWRGRVGCRGSIAVAMLLWRRIADACCYGRPVYQYVACHHPHLAPILPECDSSDPASTPLHAAGFCMLIYARFMRRGIKYLCRSILYCNKLQIHLTAKRVADELTGRAVEQMNPFLFATSCEHPRYQVSMFGSEVMD